MSTAPTAIDLTGIPVPAAIEVTDFETLNSDYNDRFLARWDAARVIDPTLPEYDVIDLQTGSAAIDGQAFAEVRLLDRQRVNDAVKAVLATTATGTDLDNIAARANVSRLTDETDASLLRRYLLSFDAPSAGSRDAYLYHALTAWPGMHDAAVIGRAVHGRRGDVDLVITGAGGALPTTQQIAAVRAAVTADDAKPEATSITVIGAIRHVYSVSLVIEIPPGPDAETVRAAAQARVLAATAERNIIGSSVPADRIAGAAYGLNVIRVRRVAPTADIAGDPYTIPVCGSLTVNYEVVG